MLANMLEVQKQGHKKGGVNELPVVRRAQILTLPCEGSSLTTLRVTPVMAAGLSRMAMNWMDIVGGMDADVPAKKHGAYEKQKAALLRRSVPD